MELRPGPEPGRQGPTGSESLRDRLRIFHPAYIPIMAKLFLISTVSAAVTFFSLRILQGLVAIFTIAIGASAGGETVTEELDFITRFFVELDFAKGWQLVALVLAVYSAIVIFQALLRFINIRVEAQLEIQSQNDIEQDILLHLLRKDDRFFHRHPVTEIANRLSMDTRDMFERRQNVSELYNALAQSIAVLVFLGMQNWTYAAAALAFTAIGIVAMHLMLGEMKDLMEARRRSDDHVKATFEDYLGAAPEVQMGGLHSKSVRQLGKVQRARQSAFMRHMVLDGRLSVIYQLNQLIALLAIIGTITYIVFSSDLASMETGLVAGLIAAAIRSVPEFYSNISEVVRLVMQFGLAEVSERRLLEYESPPAETGDGDLAPGEGARPIALERINYSYGRGEPVRGGRDGITVDFAPNSLNVLVGPAGSGKSTLSQLVMGRMKPVSGTIQLGGQDFLRFGASQRAAIFSYMPQKPILLDGSIEDNIRFGLPDGHPLADTSLEGAFDLIERTMVADFALSRALDLAPLETEFQGDLAKFRAKMRSEVESATGVRIAPFAPGLIVPHLSLLEHVTQSGADIVSVMKGVGHSIPRSAIGRLVQHPMGQELIKFAMGVIEQTRQILERSGTYDAYSELAPFQIAMPVWRLRSELARMGPLDRPPPPFQFDLLLIGLAAAPRELDTFHQAELGPRLEAPDCKDFATLATECFGTALEPLDAARVNTHLSWRDNLLFGAPEATNTRVASEVDAVLLKSLAARKLDRDLLQSGLSYQVGRQGKRLSGGQQRLVSLCRTFLQDSPVVVLDEPTADLDPKKRAAVNALLREEAGKRTLIVITHDPDLARLADQVVMMKDGGLWARGSFDQLVRENAEFRSVINVEDKVPA